ncbi:hypothetical protein E2P81_ATG03878 [Venturia nashicola]|uniref:Uncharacterized protein n=1 Tax=Venturia nashicola TaxID=86259 RepID=A0A4Z1PKA3_9PEZI|nr:hypothetical protein E6O75_ATG03969 [Venturia nashicola]TLD38203.1 hypothetical protein E2P81_ATG03878 [Venturia nashicola]
MLTLCLVLHLFERRERSHNIKDIRKSDESHESQHFDQTLTMEGDASLLKLNSRQDGEWSINKWQLEAIRWEDDNDDPVLQRALAMSIVEGDPQGEDSSAAVIAAQASSKEQSPIREPFQVAETPSSAKSTENMKYKIQQCLYDLIKMFHTSKYKATEATNVEPIEAQINSALRCCHNLAFLVQEQLFSSRRRPRRDCRRKTFEQLTREVLGTDNFLPVPLILKAVMVVVAEEFGVTWHEGNVLGGKIDRMREWRFLEKGSDYDVPSKEGGGRRPSRY